MPTSTGKIYLGSNLLSGGSGGSSAVAPTPTPWVRNPSWPACEANAGDNKVTGLYAVWPGDGVGAGGNFLTFRADGGSFNMDMGDGTTTVGFTPGGNFVYYEYDYNNVLLTGTDAPVTFTASTGIVNRTSHGYSDGMIVNFYNIITTTGLDQSQTYYVINATTNTFQVSLTDAGTAVNFTNDGTATLLPYKVAVVTITPQAGETLTLLSLAYWHNQPGLATGSALGWLDLAIAIPACTTIGIGSTSLRYPYLERVRINEFGAVTSFNNLFYNCAALREVVIADTITTVTNTTSMFYACFSLTSAPLFNTSSVTTMFSMFYNCYVLNDVPLYDTPLVTTMGSMFYNCRSLTTVPLFNTSVVTTMLSMFTGCYSLTTVPLFNTSAVTIMGNMFNNSYALTTVPLFDTSAVTDMSNMFSGAWALTTVPLFDTSAVTGMYQLFGSCYSLTTVPLFDTSAVTSMSRMFFNCYSLTTVPLFDTSAVTTMANMFEWCILLKDIPLFNTSAVTNMTAMFDNSLGLTSVPLFDTSSVTIMQSMFEGCTQLQDVPLFNTSAVTNMSKMFYGCTLLKDIPLFNTSAVTTMANMFTLASSLRACPALDITAITPSSASLNAMFTGCWSLGRVELVGLKYTITFAGCKLSTSAIDEIYTNLATVTGQTINVTGNYGNLGDNPSIATAKGWSVTG